MADCTPEGAAAFEARNAESNRFLANAPQSDDPWIGRSEGMRCRTCYVFVIKAKDTNGPRSKREVGRCRRHAPTMNGYPVVFEDDWCGDHKLNENAI